MKLWYQVFKESGIVLNRIYVLRKDISLDGVGAGKYSGLFLPTETNVMLNGLAVNGLLATGFNEGQPVFTKKLTVKTKRLSKISPDNHFEGAPLKFTLQIIKDDSYYKE